MPTINHSFIILSLLLVIGIAQDSTAEDPSNEPIPIRVDAGQEIGSCYEFWSTSNATSQHQFADPNVKLRAMQMHYPFTKYINCVRLLGGRSDGKNCYFQGVDDEGNVRADFTGLIENLRGIIRCGYTPRLVLDNVPTAMSDTEQMHKYGNTLPPSNFKVWHCYIRLAVEAIVREFGRDQVARWRFRVGTEPDLYPGHWSGTKEEYLKHYDYTVDAVLKVIPEADIGPGNILNPTRIYNKRKPWGLDIIDHIARGTNFVTGKKGSVMRHFSISWYGQVGRPIDEFDKAIGMTRERLDRYPQFRDIPVEVAEFAILQDENRRRLMCGDITEWGASWYAAVADRVYALDVARVHEWSKASAGILHPRTRVIEMLETMHGGDRLAVTAPSLPDRRCGAIACRKNDDIYVLLYHHYPDREPREKASVKLVVADPRMKSGQKWRRTESTIDHDDGVWVYRLYEDCAAVGIKPLDDAAIYGGHIQLRFGPKGTALLRGNSSTYRKLSEPREDFANQPISVEDGSARLDLTLDGHAVKLIHLQAPK